MSCKSDQILNPVTQKCVKITSPIGKLLSHDIHMPVKPCKPCIPSDICHPLSGRCIKRTSKEGTLIEHLQRQSALKHVRNNPWKPDHVDMPEHLSRVAISVRHVLDAMARWEHSRGNTNTKTNTKDSHRLVDTLVRYLESATQFKVSASIEHDYPKYGYMDVIIKVYAETRLSVRITLYTDRSQWLEITTISMSGIASVRILVPLTTNSWQGSTMYHTPMKYSGIQLMSMRFSESDIERMVVDMLGFRVPITMTYPPPQGTAYNTNEDSNYEENISFSETKKRKHVHYGDRSYNVKSKEGQRLIRDYMVKGRKIAMEEVHRRAFNKVKASKHKYVLHLHGRTRDDKFTIPQHVYLYRKTMPGMVTVRTQGAFDRFIRRPAKFFSGHENNLFSSGYRESRNRAYKVIHFPGDEIQDMDLSCTGSLERQLPGDDMKDCGVHKYPYIPQRNDGMDDLGIVWKVNRVYRLSSMIRDMIKRAQPTADNPLVVHLSMCRSCDENSTGYRNSWEQDVQARRRMGIQTIVPTHNVAQRTSLALFGVHPKSLGHSIGPNLNKYVKQIKE